MNMIRHRGHGKSEGEIDEKYLLLLGDSHS